MIAGAFVDFIVYLDALPNPIIIGGGYPRQRLLEAFNNWAQNCKFNASNANLQTWRTICSQGFLKGYSHGKASDL